MSTSLAEQLQRLAVPQTSVYKRDKKRPSLLFDPKEAAGFSKDTFYQIGLQGLEELRELNPAFDQFENTLFNVVAKDFERAIEDRKANKRIDKGIKKFLLLLSPYFLLSSSHKTLEWLIYRYSIHEYNRENLLMLILPYHETNIFVRVLQLVKIKDQNDRWFWLKSLQKAGVHLLKIVLLNHAASDASFIKFVGDFVVSVVEEHVKASDLAVVFNFYGAVVSGAIEYSRDLKETHVSQILPCLLKSLQSDVEDFCAAGYVIAAKLVSKTHLTDKLLVALVDKVTQIKNSSLKKEAVLVLIILYQSQNNFVSMSVSSLRNLAERYWFTKVLQEMNGSGSNIWALLRAVFREAIDFGLTQDDGVIKSFMGNILNDVKFENEWIQEVFDIVLELYNPKVEYTEEIQNWIISILQIIERQYPVAFDKEVNKVMQVKNDRKKQKRLRKLLNSSIDLESNFTIFEKLYHPVPKLRQEAIRFLVKNFKLLKNRQREQVKNYFLDRINDDNDEVVMETLNFSKSVIKEVVEKKELQDVLIKLLRKCRKYEEFKVKIAKSALNTLCAEFEKDDYKIFLTVLPFLLPSSDLELALAKTVVNTNFGEKCTLIKPIKQDLMAVQQHRKFFKAVVARFSHCWAHASLVLKFIKESAELELNCSEKYASMLFSVGALPENTPVEVSSSILDVILSYLETTKISAIKEDIKNETRCICFVNTEKKLPTQGMLKIITKLVRKTAKFETDFANLNLLENTTEVKFFTNFFNVFLKQTKSSTKNIYLTAFDTSMGHICPDLQNKLEFLLNFSNVPNLDSEMHKQTLNVCVRYVNSIVDVDEMKKILSIDCLIVPYILIGLCSENQDIREITFKLISSINHTENPYSMLLRGFIKHKEEILIDHEQTPLVMYNLSSPSKDQIQKVLRFFVNLSSSTDCPLYLNAGMLQLLQYINDKEIFNDTSKLPLLLLKNQTNWNDIKTTIIQKNILKFDTVIANDLTSNTTAWEFLLLSLKTQRIVYDETKTVSPAVLVLNQINRDLFETLRDDVKPILLDAIIELATITVDPEILACASKIFKHIDLDISLVLEHLKKMCDVQSKKIDESKRKRRRSVVPTIDILDLMEWKKGVTVLEFIQNKKKMKNTALLLSVSFEVLKKCLDFDEQASVEYPKQLILSSILHCCEKTTNETLPENILNVELIVQCIRASQNPQTHHHSLLVLAHIASLVPTQVLHHIMAIFTFMGSSVLRHDDAYSFQIITKIIDTIIPILVNEKTNVNVGSVLRVFVDVLLDVPEHRRMPLYKQLLERVNVEENLYLFLLLVFESHVLHSNSQKQQKNETNYDLTPKRLDIAAQLCREFSPKVVITTCVKLVECLRNLPEDKDDYRGGVTDEVAFDIRKNTPKQFRHYMYTIVLFASSLLSSQEFVRQVAAISDEDSLELETLYKDAIVNILIYIQGISKVAEKNVNTPQAQFWKAMLHYSYDILDSLNALLMPKMFLLVLRGLMVHNLNTVRRRVLELLNTKLQNQSDFFGDCEESDLFTLLSPTVDIIKSIENEDIGLEQEVLVQTALLSMKLLIKTLAPSDPQKFISILNFVTEQIKNGKTTENVLASLILCLSELCANLRAHAISSLNKYMPSLIKILKKQKSEDEPSLLLLCTVTAVQKIVDSLPLFLSPYMEKLLCEVSLLTVKWEKDVDEQKVSPVIVKLKNIQQKIGTVIPPRVLIPSIEQSYNKLVERKEFAAIGPLMNILIENIKNLNANEVNTNLTELKVLFLNALQFRCDSDATQNEINAVESNVVRALTTFVLKLSENTFKPLYGSFYQWATPKEKSDRIITFYNLSSAIAECLKGLFVLFSGYYLSNAASLLDSCNDVKSEDLYFENVDKNLALVDNILKTLYLVFLYDTHSFINRDRFNVLMQPIVDQLENTVGGIESLEKRCKEILIPCLVQFAVAAGNDALWKQLIYQILLKMRHQSPKIRLIALECTTSIIKKLEQDYLPLLPETVPFLAELLEDEDENVELACRTAVQELEKVLGEPLQKYF